jgi:hypothetical protein
MHGAEIFCAIRSYLVTASRHDISRLAALTRAASGTPWIPKPDKPAWHQSAANPGNNRDLSSYTVVGSNRPFSVPCAAMRKAPDGTAASGEAGVHPVPSRGLAGVAVDG